MRVKIAKMVAEAEVLSKDTVTKGDFPANVNFRITA